MFKAFPNLKRNTKRNFVKTFEIFIKKRKFNHVWNSTLTLVWWTRKFKNLINTLKNLVIWKIKRFCRIKNLKFRPETKYKILAWVRPGQFFFFFRFRPELLRFKWFLNRSLQLIAHNKRIVLPMVYFSVIYKNLNY